MIKEIYLSVIILLVNSLFINAQNQSKIHYNLFIGSGGKSGGIYVYDFNSETGECIYKSEVKGKEALNPTYLAISENGRNLYSVCKGDSGKDGVSAFHLDPLTARLSFLNTVSSGGDGPAYVSVDKNQKFVFVGNYTSGSLSVIPVNKNGSLSSSIQTIQHTGNSVNKTRQDRPHVHCTILSRDNRYLYATDLGTDKVNIYHVSPGNTTHPLMASEPPYIQVKQGSGPRHLTFHPNGKFAYLVQEMSGLITVYKYNNGNLLEQQTVSMLPVDFTGEIRAADIHVSPDGKFLYASNRGDANEIVIYRIGKSGNIAYVGRQSSLGKSPRNFSIDPTGNFLLVANQATDDIFIFMRNKETGLLSVTKQVLKIPGPACLKFSTISDPTGLNNTYTLKSNNLSISVDAMVGARVTSFKLNGHELLSLKQGEEKNYGSTLWLSPQGKWSQAMINNSEYKVVEFSKDYLYLKSEIDSLSGLSYSKEFFLNPADTSVSIKYTISNASKKILQVAPWEVTRVPVGGLAFYPKGPKPALSKSNLAIKDTLGIIWYPYDASIKYSKQKLFMNGSEGWMAHLQHGRIFIKQFRNIQDNETAPGEEGVEIFSNKEKPFIELENQGAYTLLLPDSSLTYEVKWLAREVVPTLTAQTGNKDLIKLVRDVVKKSRR